jgi:hypothetical protein
MAENTMEEERIGQDKAENEAKEEACALSDAR